MELTISIVKIIFNLTTAITDGIQKNCLNRGLDRSKKMLNRIINNWNTLSDNCVKYKTDSRLKIK